MFRYIARVLIPVGIVSIFVLAPLVNAQISPDFPKPPTAPNPLTKTLSIFRLNMQDKIMKAAETMPEAKYSYRSTKDVRSFAEILTHVADISHYLCSSAKGEAPQPPAKGKDSKSEIIAYLKSAFTFCDGVYERFSDGRLNDPRGLLGSQDEQDVHDATSES
ncbi:MAG TPA: DinB family protein [Bryobacteraceae bacterium]|nr:DinB family protein [Bryobacteraceae bacterium]